MFDFTNQIVVVTGASGNLGSAVARRFLAAGARLALVDHDDEGLRAAFADLAAAPEHLLLGGVDLTDEAATRQMVSRVIEQFSRIDVLANTVGGFRAGDPLHETPLETFDFMLALNARTAFILGRAVVPVMLRQGSGKIIHTAAPAGQQGRK
ncbi:MAG: SDR family oxidoreductase, partial [Chloroflexi bacterium]|nr:SDR family oxidoreductase [Chloroflexota bacterium]